MLEIYRGRDAPKISPFIRVNSLKSVRKFTASNEGRIVEILVRIDLFKKEVSMRLSYPRIPNNFGHKSKEKSIAKSQLTLLPRRGFQIQI